MPSGTRSSQRPTKFKGIVDDFSAGFYVCSEPSPETLQKNLEEAKRDRLVAAALETWFQSTSNK